MKILPLGAKLFHADGGAKSYEEANSRFSYCCESAYNRGGKIFLATLVAHPFAEFLEYKYFRLRNIEICGILEQPFHICGLYVLNTGYVLFACGCCIN